MMISSYCFGFTPWKRKQVKRFFPDEVLYFCKDLAHAKRLGLDDVSRVYIWGKKQFDEVVSYAKAHRISVFRIEDGFIRSVTLGSDLTKAYSLVVDSRGIYFDPTQESDLEYMLNTYHFDDALLKRAQRLQTYLVEEKLSKYNIQKDQVLQFSEASGKQVICVPGQVEDDASIIYGGEGMRNVELLEAVRVNCPDAFIVYKPHPDVVAGNRKGMVRSDEALHYADVIIEDVSLPSLIASCDAVHTITSLSGFEALLRGKEVHTYGMPFYAGWGLTHDHKVCQRRKRRRSLLELVAAVYILYPRYLDPKTSALCDVEVVLEAIKEEKSRYNNSFIYRNVVHIRNYVLRKLHLVWRLFVA